MPAFARQGDTHAGVCGHGDFCCPHNVTGIITGGSLDTNVNKRPAARLGDPVVHDCPHCGTGNISSASGTVKVNTLGAARIGDAVTYPGGGGTITSASEDTNAGD
jgi:uncharacterized Zn-binding protein involved in type VI secretion